MKFYRLIVILFLSFFILASHAQHSSIPAKIEWGSDFKEPANTFLSRIISQDATGFYVLREQRNKSALGKKIYIEFYNKKMEQKRVQKISLKYKKKKREFEDIILLGRELYLLSSFHNRKQKINYLFAQKINKKGLRVSDKLIRLGEIPTQRTTRDGSFDYHISKDSSKILIYHELPYEKGDPERFAFHVYDNQFNELWSKDVILPYNDENFGVEEYRVDNEGNVYLLGVIYHDQSRKRRRGKPTYQYDILAYTKQGESTEEYQLDLNDKFITDLTFRIGKDGNLVCSGFYSEKGTYSIKGTYFFRLNAVTKALHNENYKEFDLEFLTFSMSNRRKKKAEAAAKEGNTKREAELYQYSLDELILRSDGGALLIAEQYFVEERQRINYVSNVHAGNNTQRDYFYYYNDIIIVNIRPNGEIEWAKRIPKRQESVNDGGYYSSYARAVVRDKIYFVYNDNRRNFQKESTDRKRYNGNGKNTIIALTELQANGAMKTYPLFENKEADIITRPKVCKQTGKREMTIYGEIGRRFRFGTLTF